MNYSQLGSVLTYAIVVLLILAVGIIIYTDTKLKGKNEKGS